jgi:hypothetical protein
MNQFELEKDVELFIRNKNANLYNHKSSKERQVAKIKMWLLYQAHREHLSDFVSECREEIIDDLIRTGRSNLLSVESLKDDGI